MRARHLHDLRGLLAGLIAADDREGLQVVVDAARAAFGVCVHSDSADNRRHYTAMLDRVLDGVHVEREPSSHTVVGVDLDGVRRRVSASDWEALEQAEGAVAESRKVREEIGRRYGLTSTNAPRRLPGDAS